MKPDLNSKDLKWYEKKAGITQFQKDVAKEKKEKRRQRRETEKSNGDMTAKPAVQKKESAAKKNVKPASNRPAKNSGFKAAVTPKGSLFDYSRIPEDAKKIVAEFDKILLSTTPLTSKQRSMLPGQIRMLSHVLTDERNDRRVGYMNQTTTLSAYIHYFLWWNLVRLTRLFANMDDSFFDIKNDAVCLDIGSGPLTVPLALFLARPELRKKQLTWYCMDISSQALSEGENIFLTVAARLECEPWKIVRVKGDLETKIKQSADFISCANVFNEVVQVSSMPPDFLAKKYSEKVLSYTDRAADGTRILLIEPGVPAAARFVSLFRDALMRKDYGIAAPCPHECQCCMEGKKGGKWCNYAFSTEDAPSALHKLSEAAGIPKERAVLSFVAAVKNNKAESVIEKMEAELYGEEKEVKREVVFRVASDPIRLPGGRTGFYACSEKGLLLTVTSRKLHSGDCIAASLPKRELEVDQKSGALILELD